MRLQQLFVLRCPRCRARLDCRCTEASEEPPPDDPYVPERVRAAVSRIGMPELKRLCAALGWDAGLPDEYSPSEELDRRIWALLAGRQVLSGTLRCTGCAAEFEVRSGIPRMLVK